MSQDQDTPVLSELETLKARADQMGLQYHPSIGVDKLREKVLAALASDEAKPNDQAAQTQEPPVAQAPAQPVEETPGQQLQRLKRQAMELVRIRLTCMNPAKKDWPGEIITVGNSLVGSIKKFVPFTGAEDGWHVPRIMYEMLVARECQVFSTGKTARGVTMRQSKMIREFAIELLPNLTEKELHDLAQRQAMAGSIDPQ